MTIKIHFEYKIKDLYAIKHALELGIISKTQRVELVKEISTWPDDLKAEYVDSINSVDIAALEKDIAHEKRLVDHIVETVKCIKDTIAHYQPPTEPSCDDIKLPEIVKGAMVFKALGTLQDGGQMIQVFNENVINTDKVLKVGEMYMCQVVYRMSTLKEVPKG